MTISEMIREKLASLRHAQGLEECALDGVQSGVLALLAELGGHIGAQRYEPWCHSDTCQHQSHDAGASTTIVYVPAAWIEEARTASDVEWNLFEDETPMLLIPAAPEPLLVVTRDGGHFANRTYTVRLRPEAAAVLHDASASGNREP